MTINELVDLTGIPERTLRDWRKKGIIPADSAEESAEPTLLAIIHHLRRGQGEEDADELYAEKVRLTRAQADERELKVAELEGQLLDADQVQREWCKMVASFRAKILSVPIRLAAQVVTLDAAQAEALLRDYLHEALSELASYESETL